MTSIDINYTAFPVGDFTTKEGLNMTYIIYTYECNLKKILKL